MQKSAQSRRPAAPEVPRHDAKQHTSMPTFALAGNPNCGKTTLFNALTGSHQYVGNWPGVTVERKEGTACVQGQDARLVDLPGIYSLSPYSLEENVSRDYLVTQRPDVVISIVDATNLVRNLYLTIQLIELERPIVVALNMMDEVRSRGERVDIEALSSQLGVPVVPIVARTGEGVEAVFLRAMQQIGRPPEPRNRYSAALERAITELTRIVGPRARELDWPLRWSAIVALEGSGASHKLLEAEALRTKVAVVVGRLEEETGLDHEALLAESRYRIAAEAAAASVHGDRRKPALTGTERIDRVLCHPVWGLPIFALIMLTIFQITFGPVGSFLQGLLESAVGMASEWVSAALVSVGAAQWLQSLILDGIFAGVGAVLSFAPLMLILYFFLSVLEDSGYMARAAFLMDGVLAKVGLSGRSFIPMIMGFGCSVPALAAARALNNDRDRKLTMMIVPFMSCGAKMPIYIMFIGAFFQRYQAITMFSMYFLGIIVAILVASVLQRTVLKGETAPFLMEMPPYRLPTLRGTSRRIWEKLSDFVKRAGTIILASMVLIWFLQTMGPDMRIAAEPRVSLLGYFGRFIAPIFRPLGFGNWESAISLLTGFIAKEDVVATLSVLLHFDPDSAMSVAQALGTVFTPLRALSFMTFCLLYVPCMAAVATLKREMGKLSWVLGTIAMELGVAYAVSLVVFQVGTLLGFQ